MNDDDLRMTVEDELLWEPRVDNEAVAVSADDGIVTLRGSVGSFREKRAATAAAKRVYGVKDVDNQLEVELLDDERREDADIRGDILQALMIDALVPSTVDVSVDDGWVTLTGTADYQFQRDEAEHIAGNAAGVSWLDDEITMTMPPATSADVHHAIKKAFERDAKLDADVLSVQASDGSVTLSGPVSSWAEHDSAIAAAWAAPGVTDITDDLYVTY